MAKALIRAIAVAMIAGIGVVAPVTVAAADVVTPPGACHGAGTWQGAGFSEDSANHVKTDVIKVPREDTVLWSGELQGHKVGDVIPRRDIKGKVQVAMPKPFGLITIDDWGGSSVRAANNGDHHYNVPSVLVGVKMKLSGEHSDGGTLTCKGEVFVEITGGTNPIKLVGLGGMALTFLALVAAGRPAFIKIKPAFEDVNPG